MSTRKRQINPLTKAFDGEVPEEGETFIKKQILVKL